MCGTEAEAETKKFTTTAKNETKQNAILTNIIWRDNTIEQKSMGRNKMANINREI